MEIQRYEADNFIASIMSVKALIAEGNLKKQQQKTNKTSLMAFYGGHMHSASVAII